ncbi:MAG: hypothetical protein V4796_02280 [Burkholderia cenocepacia]
MKTSEFIDVIAAKLHQLLDHHREPADTPELIDELTGIAQHIGDIYYPALKHAEALVGAARSYYGPESRKLDGETCSALDRTMRNAVVKLATESTRCRMNND